jgi:trehalose 6-phosphate phosphatase
MSNSAEALPQPQTEAGRQGLGALLAEPAAALLAVDFDGTLAPIVEDPAQARPAPGAVEALARLAPRLAAVAIVTGRPAATAVEYGGFADVPGLERLVVLGHYGLERWDAATGQATAPDAGPAVKAARSELTDVLQPTGVADQVWVEDKGASFAVHTRRSKDPAAALAAIQDPVAQLAERHGLRVESGRYVLELRPPGTDKGAALAGAAAAYDARCVVFAGDDLGDLAAYDAVDELRAAGTPGLLIFSGSTETTELADRADLVLDGPPGVVAFLTALANTLN